MRQAAVWCRVCETTWKMTDLDNNGGTHIKLTLKEVASVLFNYRMWTKARRWSTCSRNYELLGVRNIVAPKYFWSEIIFLRPLRLRTRGGCCVAGLAAGWRGLGPEEISLGFAADKVVVLSVLAGLVAVHTELAAMIASILAHVTSQGEQPVVCLSTLHII